MAERVSEEAGLLLDQVVVPDPIPVRKIPGYRMPEHARNLLPWDFVATQMQQASHYWLNTTFGDGRPHAVPVWGIWYPGSRPFRRRHEDHVGAEPGEGPSHSRAPNRP